MLVADTGSRAWPVRRRSADGPSAGSLARATTQSREPPPAGSAVRAGRAPVATRPPAGHDPPAGVPAARPAGAESRARAAAPTARRLSHANRDGYEQARRARPAQRGRETIKPCRRYSQPSPQEEATAILAPFTLAKEHPVDEIVRCRHARDAPAFPGAAGAGDAGAVHQHRDRVVADRDPAAENQLGMHTLRAVAAVRGRVDITAQETPSTRHATSTGSPSLAITPIASNRLLGAPTPSTTPPPDDAPPARSRAP
jgi:hypothetical protein